MTNRGQKIGITVGAMILFGICAHFFHDYFLRFVLSQFSDLDVRFELSAMDDVFKLSATFVSVISMLPALFLFSHFILKDQKPKVFLLIVPIVLLSGIAMMALHLYLVRTEVQGYSDLSLLGIRNSLSLSTLHAERYLGIGFILGTIFSTAIISFTSRDTKS